MHMRHKTAINIYSVYMNETYWATKVCLQVCTTTYNAEVSQSIKKHQWVWRKSQLLRCACLLPCRAQCPFSPPGGSVNCYITSQCQGPLNQAAALLFANTSLYCTTVWFRRSVPDWTGSRITDVLNTSGCSHYKNSSSFIYRISWAELGTWDTKRETQRNCFKFSS